LIPTIVTEFIAKHIHSMDVLEILLFLRKESPREWTPIAVSKALMLERSSVQTRLEYLLSAGLLNVETVDGERLYGYRTTSKELSEAADELARWYGSHRVSIISLVFSHPSEQIWTYLDNRADHDEADS
jgi:predicted transcriptional regulator